MRFGVDYVVSGNLTQIGPEIWGIVAGFLTSQAEIRLSVYAAVRPSMHIANTNIVGK